MIFASSQYNKYYCQFKDVIITFTTTLYSIPLTTPHLNTPSVKHPLYVFNDIIGLVTQGS